ncbi:MAG: prolipoprotein diacylglyceryl transferase [Clostridia bacterium]|nr:prolipoprotein diacylglyceryl transferase [Clostridia bacterium]
MLPHIHIMGFSIPMYSLMIFFGFIGFLILTYITFTRFEPVKRDTLMRLFLVSVVSFGVMGVSAWLFDAIFFSIEAGKLVSGGITWLGSVAGGFPTAIFLIHKFVPEAKGRTLYFFSLMMPGIVLAHGLGRVGCFFAGCCYGQVTDSIFGVSFPEGSSAAHQFPAADGSSLPVLPTQLFEAVFELIMCIVMLAGRKKFKNYNLEIWCFAYGLFRFIMEFFRADSRGGTGFFLTPSQFLSVCLWIAATLLILFKRGVIFKKLYAKGAVWREQVRLDAIKKKHDRRCCATLSAANALRELHKLHEEGILTKEEYEKKKKELVDRL